MANLRPMGKALRWALSLIFSGIALWAMVGALLLVLASWRQGYSWDEMDWNDDGSTSISEFLGSSDIGRRQITENAGDCIEYYSMKSGMPIKIICQRQHS